MIKRFFTACFFVFFTAIESFACVMVPSVWKTIESSAEELQGPTVYAMNEAFMQLRQKFAKEMKVCNIPVKPFTVRGLFSGKEGKKANKETYSSVKESLELIFNHITIPAFDKLPKNADSLSQQTKASDDFYNLELYVSDYKRTNIYMIDMNMQIWALLHFVIRDEACIYVRISDNNDNPIFIDEFDVSPTIVIDPLISPVLGLLETVERNNSSPVHVDWGSIGDSKEHVLRVNTSFYPPSDTPPLEILKSDLVKGLEKEERDNNACKQLVYAIKAEDITLLEVVLDTYPESNYGNLNDEGKAPIHYAALSGNEEIIKKLLDRKINISLPDKQGNNALHMVLMSDKVSIPICELLVKSGIDTNAKNNEGKTPLELANQKKISLDF